MTTPAPDQPAFLRLTLQGNAMTSSLLTPSVTIDGYPLPARYGEQVLPIHPGEHVVAARCQWLWTYGQAEQRIQAAPGQTVDVFYAAPVLTFLPGAMGPVPQKRAGLGALLGCLGALVLVLLLAGVLVVLASLA
ncbi:MAG: hypothetical protein PGN07_04870 [Aeromicrobium erythreum]